MRFPRTVAFVLGIGLCAIPATAAPILVDFETLADLELLDDQFAAAGLLFSGATALHSGAVGGSLNEIDFPPFSGIASVFDSSPGGIRVDFLNGALEVSGRLTYVTPVTMTAYSGATVLGSMNSLFSQNVATSANPANELFQLAFATPISHVIFTGETGLGSFTLDDFFANTVDEVASVPEPGTAALLLLGASLVGWRRRFGSS